MQLHPENELVFYFYEYCVSVSIICKKLGSVIAILRNI